MRNNLQMWTCLPAFLKMFVCAIAMLLNITAFCTGSVHAYDYCHYPTQGEGSCTGITWPTTWYSTDSRVERSDDTTAGDMYNYVGNLSNPGIYYAKNSSYFFVRMRVYYNGTVGSSSFTGGTIWAYLNTDGLATSTPNYALAFDVQNYPSFVTTHGLEMQRFSTGSSPWGAIVMDDVDGSSSKKYSPAFGSGIAGDIDGETDGTATFSRAEGFIRTVDQVACTTGTDSVCPSGHNYHTFIDFAVKCSYFTDTAPALANLCTSNSVRVLTGAINNKNDHNSLGTGSANSDISSGLSLSAEPSSSDWNNPTLAVIHNVNAYTRNGQVIIGWDTASEVGTVGFNVYRVDPASGERTRINIAIIPALIESPSENEYYAVDPATAPSERLTYLLEEVESKGTTRIYGPYTVTPRERWKGISPARLLGEFSFYGRMAKRDFPKPFLKNPVIWSPRGNIRTKSIRIGIREPGLYRLDATDIATAFGIPLSAVKTLLRANQYSLSNRGNRIGMIPAGDGSALYFYGEAIESIYTDVNTYTLSRGRAALVPTVFTPPPGAHRGSSAFFDHQHIEQNTIAAQAGFTDTEGDFWVWDYMVAGDPQLQTKAFEVPVQGVAGRARLTANLRGLSQSGVANEHFVTVYLNGQPIGQDTWDGSEPRGVCFDVPSGLLLEGDNTVKLTAQLRGNTSYSLIGVDSFDIDYQRSYKAFSDRLALVGDDNGEVVVNGFSSSDIWVLDLANKGIPSIVSTARTGGSPGSAWVRFRPANRDTPYLAVNPAGALRPALITPTVMADLKARTKGAEYLVITTNDLRDGAEKLADYRSARGLSTLVITIDEIYTEFSWGIATPHAIRDFIEYAVSVWLPSPRFVVLAGDGSYDYKNYLGYGDSLVPSLLTKTPWSIGVSDALLVDVKHHDGLQDVAVGRIPVTTDAQLADYVSKIARFEATEGEWKEKVLLVADNPDDGGNFPADSEDIAALVPSWLAPERIYMQLLPLADARSLLQARWTQGARFVNYFGHAGYDRIAPEGLLTKDDVPSLQNRGRLPILAGMSCNMGQFGVPGIETISETLVKQHDGGAAAVWAAASAAYQSDSKMLATKFWERLAASKEPTLGEAVSAALKNYRNEGGLTYILHTYTVLGDPAISVKNHEGANQKN